MKITIEHYEETYTYESKYDSMGMSDVAEKLYGLCIAAGYHPDSVGECFFEKGREMTEHLYPDDKMEEEDVMSAADLRDAHSSWASVPAAPSWAGSPAGKCVQPGAPGSYESAGASSFTVKSRYNEERKFTIVAKNCVEYSFKDVEHIGCSFQEDEILESVEPSGGPYICLGTNLGEVHKELEGLTVTKIKADTDKVGTYYLTVKDYEYKAPAWVNWPV
jgi:hypothetical protein